MQSFIFISFGSSHFTVSFAPSVAIGLALMRQIFPLWIPTVTLERDDWPGRRRALARTVSLRLIRITRTIPVIRFLPFLLQLFHVR